MKIETTDKKIVDTDKLPDAEAQLIEAIEGSNIRQLVHDHKGACLVWGSLPPHKKGWITFYLMDGKAMACMVNQVDDLVKQMTKGEWSVRLVPNEKKD